MPAGSPRVRAASKWVLYRSSGGYKLESEIDNHAAGLRVMQVEELTDGLVPTSLAYEFYRTGNSAPGAVSKCDIAAAAVTCRGNSEKERTATSAPYKINGPFLIRMEGKFSQDVPWLWAGALNMAHPEKGKTSIKTLVVTGGTTVLINDLVGLAALEKLKQPGQSVTEVVPGAPVPWKFNSEEESPLELVGTETMDLNGTKVSVKHYAPVNRKGQAGFWITDSGLLIKYAMGASSSYSLANYKQYKKLVSELPVEGKASEVQ